MKIKLACAVLAAPLFLAGCDDMASLFNSGNSGPDTNYHRHSSTMDNSGTSATTTTTYSNSKSRVEVDNNQTSSTPSSAAAAAVVTTPTGKAMNKTSSTTVPATGPTLGQ